jgi:predicted alpha/beta-hydrolase family hydrolase
MARQQRPWTVKTADGSTTAILDDVSDPPQALRDVVFLCGHGAGGHLSDRGTVGVAHALRDRGLRVVRYNFEYSDKGVKRPDPMPKAMACLAAVLADVRKRLAPKRVILGGRSFGGRVASMLAADPAQQKACDALLLYAYPLHPAGAPEKLRDAHLRDIRVPVACFNGTRDELCTRAIMERVLHEARAARAELRWTQHWLHDADHSFQVRKSSGTTNEATLARVADESVAFAGEV